MDRGLYRGRDRSSTRSWKARFSFQLVIRGDGIVTVTASGAQVERNVVDGFNTLGTSFNAGAWEYNTIDSIDQFNGVSHGEHGPLDSMAYEIDEGNRSPKIVAAWAEKEGRR